MCALPIKITYNKPKSDDKKKNIIPTRNYNINKADWIKLRKDYLHINWSPLYKTKNVDECFDIFYNKLYTILNEHIPQQKSHKLKHPHWWSKTTLKLHRKKLRDKQKPTYTKIHEDRKTQTLKTFQISVKKDYDNYVKNTVHELKTEPKKFWSYIKSKRKFYTPKSFIIDDMLTSDETKIANGFAKYFGSVYLDPKTIKQPVDTTSTSNTHIHLSNVTNDEIKQAIKILPANKGPGPDHIHPKIIKNMQNVLIPELNHLFNTSIKNHHFPNILKTSIITPVPKTGNLQLMKNYRPITTLNSIAKVFENIIYIKLHKNIMHNITTQQHGFLKKRSTETNLMIMESKIKKAFNNNQQLDTIYTDISKFFDQVHFSVLLNNMKKFGFTDDTTTFINSYLNNRTIQIKYGDTKSREIIPTSGFPQGSKLSSLFAILMMNGVIANLKHSEALIFADDLKIFKSISCKDDCHKLQEDINNAHKWSTENGLQFNISKCEQVQFCRGKIKFQHQYYLANEPLKNVKEKKDLGVIFQHDGKFNIHIKTTISNCFKRLGLIKRHAQQIQDLDTLIMLYNSIIRSKLEYCSNVWNPKTKDMINEIEKVQKRFTQYLFYLENKFYPTYPEGIAYKDLIEQLNIQTLEERREGQKLIFLHKLFNNKIDCPELLSNINIQIPYARLRINDNYVLFENTSNIKYPSAINKILEAFNKRYENLDLAMSYPQLLKIIGRH